MLLKVDAWNEYIEQFGSVGIALDARQLPQERELPKDLASLVICGEYFLALLDDNGLASLLI